MRIDEDPRSHGLAPSQATQPYTNSAGSPSYSPPTDKKKIKLKLPVKKGKDDRLPLLAAAAAALRVKKRRVSDLPEDVSPERPSKQKKEEKTEKKRVKKKEENKVSNSTGCISSRSHEHFLLSGRPVFIILNDFFLVSLAGSDN